jgi:ankyrin repeat protein
MDWRWEDQERAVLSTCSSLISVQVVKEDGSQVVQFSHFSVKEFLTSSRLAVSSGHVSSFHILLEPAHTILAKACLGVLLRSDEHMDGDNAENNFSLARYAAEHWIDHANFERVLSQVREGMEDLFDPDRPYFSAWLRVYNMDTMPSRSLGFRFFCAPRYLTITPTPLYYAALCGFRDLAEHLIVHHPQQVNAKGGCYVSPLGAAIGRKHLDVAQLLYEHGADVNVQGFRRWTLLHATPRLGHPKVVEWLLSHGADPNHRYNGLTPLHVAAGLGQVDVSRMLLQHKADQNAPVRGGRTPLHVASRNGHIDVARLLLEHGVNVNAQDDNRSTALHLASKEGHIDVARLLLEHGVDVNAQCCNRSTALHLASWKSRSEVACLLLEHGADLDAENGRGRTPFQVASGDRRDEIKKLLSERLKARSIESS